MSTAWVECWKCDECGHRWIKGENWPDRCASSKCRKRTWNKNATKTKVDGSQHPEARRGEIIPPSSTPIGAPIFVKCPANNLKEQLEASIADIMAKPAVSPAEISREVLLCPKQWPWVDGDNELYHCALREGHKGNCTRGAKV